MVLESNSHGIRVYNQYSNIRTPITVVSEPKAKKADTLRAKTLAVKDVQSTIPPCVA
jgi:hypothetical protein